MAVLRESPWYQEIEQRGIRIGEELGEQRGRSTGNFIQHCHHFRGEIG
ncbi:hypothetical protein [Gloeocapsopsis sp. IPPAS B-1203]|nr:hypothetical protein [Gloeocapsopsis sp. IPPAS B-1203]